MRWGSSWRPLGASWGVLGPLGATRSRHISAKVLLEAAFEPSKVPPGTLKAASELDSSAMLSDAGCLLHILLVKLPRPFWH